MGSNDDGGRNRGTKNDEDSEYRGGGLDSVPHHGLGEGWPEEKEEEHGTLGEHRELALESMSIVETEYDGRMTYENGGGVDTSEDGESSNANDVVVVQRGTGLIILNGFLEVEVPVMIHGLVSDTNWSARRL